MLTQEEIRAKKVNLRKDMRKYELNQVLWALHMASNSRTVAAELLGLNRTTLVETMRRLGILQTTPKTQWKRKNREVQKA